MAPNVSQHEAEIERLRRRYNHSITLVEAVDDATPGHGQYTCFMHAIGLRTPPALIVKIMKRFDHVYPGAEFVRVLIDVGLLKAARGRPGNNYVVLYFSGETPRHAGRWHEGLVVSKWGLGHLWRHPLFEVPASYGDEIKIFEGVDGTAAATWFVKYSTQKLGAAIILQLGDAGA